MWNGPPVLLLVALFSLMLECYSEDGSGPPDVGDSEFELLAGTAAEAGDADGQCGSPSQLRYNDRVMVCVGFESENSREAGGPGSKAVFHPRVDEYSSISVAELQKVLGTGNWSAEKSEFSYMWVGVNGQRSVGQEKGFVSESGRCVRVNSSFPEWEEKKQVCYGWALHNKPVVNEDNLLSTGITAIVHLENGDVNRVVWDVGCNLCPPNKGELQCLPDNTSAVCSSDGDGECVDCYLSIGNQCGLGQHLCAPIVYLAWVGTDRNGTPMTSAGKILSRFADYSLQPVYDDLYKQVERVTE